MAQKNNINGDKKTKKNQSRGVSNFYDAATSSYAKKNNLQVLQVKEGASLEAIADNIVGKNYVFNFNGVQIDGTKFNNSKEIVEAYKAINGISGESSNLTYQRTTKQHVPVIPNMYDTSQNDYAKRNGLVVVKIPENTSLNDLANQILGKNVLVDYKVRMEDGTYKVFKIDGTKYKTRDELNKACAAFSKGKIDQYGHSVTDQSNDYHSENLSNRRVGIAGVVNQDYSTDNLRDFQDSALGEQEPKIKNRDSEIPTAPGLESENTRILDESLFVLDDNDEKVKKALSQMSESERQEVLEIRSKKRAKSKEKSKFNLDPNELMPEFNNTDAVNMASNFKYREHKLLDKNIDGYHFVDSLNQQYVETRKEIQKIINSSYTEGIGKNVSTVEYRGEKYRISSKYSERFKKLISIENNMESSVSLTTKMAAEQAVMAMMVGVDVKSQNLKTNVKITSDGQGVYKGLASNYEQARARYIDAQNMSNRIDEIRKKNLASFKNYQMSDSKLSSIDKDGFYIQGGDSDNVVKSKKDDFIVTNVPQQNIPFGKAYDGTMGSNADLPLSDDLDSQDGTGSTLDQEIAQEQQRVKAEGEAKKANELVEAKKKKIKLRILSAIAPAIPYILMFFAITVVVASIFLPVMMNADDIKKGLSTVTEKLGNYLKFNKFETNEALMTSFYEKIDKTEEIVPEIDRYLLLATMYYGFYDMDKYLDELDEGEGNDLDEDYDPVSNTDDLYDFTMFEKYTYTVSNQMIYSTLVFHNDIYRKPKEKEKTKAMSKDECAKLNGTYENGKCKYKEKDGYEYFCSNAGSFQGTLSTDIEKLCTNDVYNPNVIGSNEMEKYITTDACRDIRDKARAKQYKIEDPNFDENMTCYYVKFESGTDLSEQKMEKFLKYLLVPQWQYSTLNASKEKLKRILNYIPDWIIPSWQTSLLLDTEFTGASWDEMISIFVPHKSELGDLGKDRYNIPDYVIGPGKKYDLYSKLEKKEQLEVDRKVRDILSMANDTKKIIEGKVYTIPGSVRLPIDIVIDPNLSMEENIKKKITSPFGNRKAEIAGMSVNHRGVDFGASTGTPVYSIADGKVVKISKINEDCGIGVDIGHDIDKDGNDDYITRYCHFSEIYVSNIGEEVYNGKIIGKVGSTGVSTGPHLHFGINKVGTGFVDPVPYLVDILNKNSKLDTTIKTLNDDIIAKLNNSYYDLISNKYQTREAVAISAKFLVDNLGHLPYFCGGSTQELIDSSWYKNKMVTNKSCSNTNSTTKYGLDDVGFINWALYNSGYPSKTYTLEELKSLGENYGAYEKEILIGDLAYSSNSIGIVIESDNDKFVVAYMDQNDGLTATVVNKNQIISEFSTIVSMDKIYSR